MHVLHASCKWNAQMAWVLCKLRATALRKIRLQRRFLGFQGVIIMAPTTVKLHVTLAKIASSFVQNPEETTGHDALTREALPLELGKCPPTRRSWTLKYLLGGRSRFWRRRSTIRLRTLASIGYEYAGTTSTSPWMRAPSGKTCSFNTYRTTTTFLSTSTTPNTTGRRRTLP